MDVELGNFWRRPPNDDCDKIWLSNYSTGERPFMAQRGTARHSQGKGRYWFEYVPRYRGPSWNWNRTGFVPREREMLDHKPHETETALARSCKPGL